MWFCVHAIGAIAVILVVTWSLEQQQTNLFVTTLYDTSYQISDIGFPGKCQIPHAQNGYFSKKSVQQCDKIESSIILKLWTIHFFPKRNKVIQMDLSFSVSRSYSNLYLPE